MGDEDATAADELEEICLEEATIHRLVDRTVGAIALDCGYHLAHQSSLDILTDVCCDYLRRIASLLRVSRDTEELRDCDSDFVDSLERVFHQLNVPSVANLHQFIRKLEAIKKHKNKLSTTSSNQQQQSAQQLLEDHQQHETRLHHHHQNKHPMPQPQPATMTVNSTAKSTDQT